MPILKFFFLWKETCSSHFLLYSFFYATPPLEFFLSYNEFCYSLFLFVYFLFLDNTTPKILSSLDWHLFLFIFCSFLDWNLSSSFAFLVSLFLYRLFSSQIWMYIFFFVVEMSMVLQFSCNTLIGSNFCLTGSLCWSLIWYLKPHRVRTFWKFNMSKIIYCEILTTRFRVMVAKYNLLQVYVWLTRPTLSTSEVCCDGLWASNTVF